ncbi:plasmid mobilization relaxosome protein MobC [Alcaligenes sp. HNGD-HTN06]|uniref:plasmid mobilization relaxosome protein MobC n=1 Tax=Alcaligenes sp. HNGD-HTN06 TaxID=3416924 RepID=UPI003CF677DF
MSEQKERGPSLRMDVYLGDLKTPWVAYCASVGKKPGAALREAIEKQLAGLQAGKPRTVFKPVEEVQHEAKKRFEIMLTDSEREALATRAKEENTSGRQFVIDALRAVLTHEPQLSMKEIEILGESNFQLLAVGRNLNPIARRLNEGKHDPVTAAHIEELKTLIDMHVQKASDCIRANIERWNFR